MTYLQEFNGGRHLRKSGKHEKGVRNSLRVLKIEGKRGRKGKL